MEPSPPTTLSKSSRTVPSQSPQVINPARGPLDDYELADAPGERPGLKLQGKKRPRARGPVDGELLGLFRNTYYDFPAVMSYSGTSISLMGSACKPIAQVPKDFYDAVCVQGSGTLLDGSTVSFAKRNCSCAAVCPRTGQKICFDKLSREEFPWGRGARGTPITPLLTVAVDSDIIPLGTKLYLLEYDGVPRSSGGAPHDGCFIAEDRGMKVKGMHIDIFAGNPHSTAHFNQKVPSNVGVHVYIGTARCG